MNDAKLKRALSLREQELRTGLNAHLKSPHPGGVQADCSECERIEARISEVMYLTRALCAALPSKRKRKACEYCGGRGWLPSLPNNIDCPVCNPGESRRVSDTPKSPRKDRA